MKIEDLINSYISWWEDLVAKRIKNDENGRSWVTKLLDFTGKLELDDINTFFDRSDQNQTYEQRYASSGSSKLPYASYQTEVNMIQSFHKSFGMRHKTRLKYYRDDLSQKGAHAVSAVNISLAKFLAFREIIEKGNAQD